MPYKGNIAVAVLIDSFFGMTPYRVEFLRKSVALLKAQLNYFSLGHDLVQSKRRRKVERNQQKSKHSACSRLFIYKIDLTL